MTKLIVLGHGLSKNGAWDPGTKGQGTTEADWLGRAFYGSLRKYATKGIEFYEQNMFANRDADTIKAYDEIIELHLDWAPDKKTSGGHVIINSSFKPDSLDNRLGKVIEKHFGLRGGKMFDYCKNLYNLNTFARRGISYRLLELGFISSPINMNHFKANYDAIAKELVEAIMNSKVEAKPVNPSAGSYTVKPGDTLWQIATAYGETVASLKTANNLKSDVIHPGDVLRVDGVNLPMPAPEVKPAETPKAINYTGTSIVDYLNFMGMDSSPENRAKLAKQYGVKNYAQTAAKNTELLNAMRGGQKASQPSFVGRRAESIHNGNLRFYNKASWNDKDVAGTITRGLGFPTIVRKVKVGNAEQYEVKNSRGAIFNITASSKYVKVI